MSPSDYHEDWPSDSEFEFAQHGQAVGIYEMIRNGKWQDGSVDRVHILGNYVLLTSFITPDFDNEGRRYASRLAIEESIFIAGMVNAGFRVDSAERNAQITYGSNLRRRVYPLNHIPSGAPEVAEKVRNGRVTSRTLKPYKLCEEAIKYLNSQQT